MAFDYSGPSSDELISPHEAFLALSNFIREFERRSGDDLLKLLDDTMPIAEDGGPSDPIAWDYWLASVNQILSDRESRDDING